MKNYKQQICLVCESKNINPFLTFYSKYLPKLFKKIAICNDCSHVQIYPLFDDIEYEKINNEFFGDMYMVANQTNTKNNFDKINRIDNYLSAYIEKGMAVLDVGGGESWALQFFLKKECSFNAIEMVPRLAKLIEKKGGNVIGKSIYHDYSKYKNSFDIIIFRHVLEHLIYPKKALLKLKKLLSSNGVIYLVVPNGAEPTKNKGFKNILKKGFRTSFLRPIHISYFSSENIINLASSIGLNAVKTDDPDELVFILKHGKIKTHVNNLNSVVKQTYLKIARKTFFNDYLKISKIIIKLFLKKYILNKK